MALTSCLLYMSYLPLEFSPHSAPGRAIPSMSSSQSLFSDTVYNYSYRSIRPEPQFLKSTLEMHTFESDYPFCSNLRCELHVRAGDTGVDGFGNWAHLPNGRIVGRGLYNGVFLCDLCGRTEIGAAVRTPTEAAA
jgi:hypothetical protein